MLSQLSGLKSDRYALVTVLCTGFIKRNASHQQSMCTLVALSIIGRRGLLIGHLIACCLHSCSKYQLRHTHRKQEVISDGCWNLLLLYFVAVNLCREDVLTPSSQSDCAACQFIPSLHMSTCVLSSVLKDCTRSCMLHFYYHILCL